MGQKATIRFQSEPPLRLHTEIISPPSADLPCTIHVSDDTSFYPKQFPLFCLLRLICASA